MSDTCAKGVWLGKGLGSDVVAKQRDEGRVDRGGGGMTGRIVRGQDVEEAAGVEVQLVLLRWISDVSKSGGQLVGLGEWNGRLGGRG